MRVRKPRAGDAYVAAVVTAGLAVLALLAASWAPQAGAPNLALWLFAGFIVAGELYPLPVPRGEREGRITTSTTFAFALLLLAGTAAAAVVLAAASLLADLLGRKPWSKSLFNVGQLTLSVTAAGVTLLLLVGTPVAADPAPFRPAELPAIMLAAAVFFCCNVGLTGTVVALTEGLSLKQLLWRDLSFHASAAAVLLALSPVVVAAAERSLALVPLLVLPMVAVHRVASVYVERQRQALHDPLTGLPNRALFRDRVQQATLAAQRSGSRCAAMVIDLDRFKEVNDTLGHDAGDLVLREVAPRLRGVLRESDTVARTGGDEFGAVLWGVTDAAAARQVAGKMRAALQRPFDVQGLALDIDASIGIALFPDHGRDHRTLLTRADVAMYAAKRARVGYKMYAPEQEQRSPAKLALVGKLRRAVQDDQFVVHYQPQVRLETSQVNAVEALVRWRDPQRGLVAPDEFITVAEDVGLIEDLTRSVLRKSLQQCRQWRAAGLAIGVGVNVSAHSLQSLDLPDVLASLLVEEDTRPQDLALEITESAIMSDPERAKTVLTRLHDMGISLAIDDYGTGNTSLLYLARLPVQELKIDKSFVLDMVSDRPAALIVRSTIDLARNLGLRVVAEGVESKEQWERLADLGCDVAQGYYISRPLPGPELTIWLE
ncbi:MAG: EAL domain-containing protein, partial [Actinomycetota bacterium]|nr:EAL domain-containing protein [Actinomycetota bacterium]